MPSPRPAPDQTDPTTVSSPGSSVGSSVVTRAQEGDEAAFQELFEAHKDKVYSVALRYAGDTNTAADIAQETFLKLLSRIGQFRGDASFESWLYRAVVNACMDHHRRRRKLMPLVMEVFDRFRAPERGALDSMLGQERARQVQEAVAKLPVEQRMAIVLRYTEGLSYEEIAEALECSPGTVASRLNRAHKNLERRLRPLKTNAKTANGSETVASLSDGSAASNSTRNQR